ncbi:hypothetical protein CK203_107106 [Vitis vinifera]|uniref:Retrotransposon gag domain-containing protein n=1 Tax=Vitis vinifera TaxID=29760 RepID=A0A438ETP9_VITVI|nr:hypothetical protein CK203_107106 [Vitis vinifera]
MFSLVGIYRGMLRFGALGLVLIVSPSSKLGIKNQFFSIGSTSWNLVGRFSRFIESAEPTTNPYGFLVVKQAEKKLKEMSWPCKSKRSNEGCGSHADEGNFGAEGEGTQEAQMLKGYGIKGKRIGEQRSLDILERGNPAGERTKGSPRFWHFSSPYPWGLKPICYRALVSHLEGLSQCLISVSMGNFEVMGGVRLARDHRYASLALRLARDHSESHRSGGSGEGPQIGDSTGDRTQNLWFHKRIKLELELGLLIEIDLGSRAWIRIGDRLVRGSDSPSQLEQIPDHRDMDPQYATVDQLAEITDTMASLRDAILGLGQRIDGHQAQPLPIPGSTLHDSTHTTTTTTIWAIWTYYTAGLHSSTTTTTTGSIVDDTQARIDKIEQRMRSLHVSDRIMGWDGYDDMPVAALPVEFRMPDIERYTGIGCPRIHLQLYSTVMRGHRLDEAQMIMLFPLSLSGAAQRWFASLDPSRRRTWADLGQEFIRQYSFNTIVDVSRRELEALRQGPDETVTSFISRWREKIAQIIDRPSERDQISMIMRSLQPRFARHLMGFPQTDFGSLVQALYGIEEGISRGLWADSSPSDSKGKKSGSGPRPSDVGTIGMTGHRSSRRPPFQSQFLGTPYQMIQHDQYRPVAPIRPVGLLIYIRHHSRYMLHRHPRGRLCSSIISIEHRLHRGQLDSSHSLGCH